MILMSLGRLNVATVWALVILGSAGNFAFSFQELLNELQSRVRMSEFDSFDVLPSANAVQVLACGGYCKVCVYRQSWV